MSASSSPPPPPIHAPAAVPRWLGKRPLVLSSSSGDDGDGDNKRGGSLQSSECSSNAPARMTQGKAAAEAECYVCRRLFGTWKALFGHMRCHPEREWRGVRPLPEGEGVGGRRKRRPAAAEEAVAASLLGMRKGGDVEGGQYTCGECGSLFGTRQALGGHRASHRGVMGCSAKAKDTMITAADEGGTSAAAAEGDLFACRECTRRFATYHGMRIHQRIHRQGVRDGGREEGALALPAAATGEEPGGVRGKGCMVDLNLPPPEEEEQEDLVKKGF